jgi:hypothetical protein
MTPTTNTENTQKQTTIETKPSQKIARIKSTILVIMGLIGIGGVYSLGSSNGYNEALRPKEALKTTSQTTSQASIRPMSMTNPLESGAKSLVDSFTYNQD